MDQKFDNLENLWPLKPPRGWDCRMKYEPIFDRQEVNGVVSLLKNVNLLHENMLMLTDN